jgi:hypothetical protein
VLHAEAEHAAPRLRAHNRQRAAMTAGRLRPGRDAGVEQGRDGGAGFFALDVVGYALAPTYLTAPESIQLFTSSMASSSVSKLSNIENS